MKRYTCLVCGYVYDEAKGSPESGVAPGTPWDKLPPNWVCPLWCHLEAEFKKDSRSLQRNRKPKPEMTELTTQMMS